MESSNKDKLIVALDLQDLNKTQRIVSELSSYVNTFKIGLQLFSKYGKDAVKMVQYYGCKIFLDLKFYDIPSTVARASEVVTSLGISMFNVHALGGIEMMRAAKEATERRATHFKIQAPKVLGVTILTSIDEKILKEEIGVKKSISSYVKHLSLLAEKAGLDGVVAAPEEIKTIRKAVGKNFLIVTPGIRFSNSKPDDQKRIMTPKEAIREGADYIVIGRPVVESRNPVEVVRTILENIDE